MNSKVYKWCAVPQCKNTSIKTPDKVFVHVPNKKIIRDKWLKLARRNPNDVVTNSPLYFCEDHFDLPNDMENYMQYHVMGTVSQVRMKPGCMPKKFICQPDRKTRTSDTSERPYIAKKRRIETLEEYKEQLEEKSIVTEQSNSEETSSGRSALGPLLPQMNVFGRQLGVSPQVMGLVTAVLPLLWAAAKPIFGYVVDFWPRQRKLVFMLLIIVMTGSYCCLWFLPMPDSPEPDVVLESVYELNETVYIKTYDNQTDAILDQYTCHWNCTTDNKFKVYLSNSTVVNSLFIDNKVTNSSCSLLHMGFDAVREGEVMCVPKEDCNLLCFEINKTDMSEREMKSVNVSEREEGLLKTIDDVEEGSFYMTATFWAFVVLMCIGTVAFNVANCIGDAVCFDMLGPERGSKYGAQRAWGTAGYGAAALLGGWWVDAVSDTYKDFTPAFAIAIVATVVDVASCRALTLPSLSSPDDSGRALREVLRIPKVLLFVTFAVVAGTFDSFIIYYMFWFLEELAEQTGSKAKIKLIEGVVVAAQSFVGELLFFFFSGKIIKRWGYGKTMTFSLFCYGVRLALISLIQHPWHLVFIEAVMQGPTYALCYSTIVGYAAHVAPEGYSATVQGIVAGMDDGVGFAFGSILGGQVYGLIGGRSSFRVFAAAAVTASALHALLFTLVTRRTERKEKEYTSPEADKMIAPVEEHSVIYRPTVMPLGSQEVDR